jgi:hypothetical protein
MNPLELGPSSAFRMNSDNLLNLFRNGDEFLLNLEIEESSPTWPAYLEFNQADQEGFILNLREYFKTWLNPDKNNSLINFKVSTTSPSTKTKPKTKNSSPSSRSTTTKLAVHRRPFQVPNRLGQPSGSVLHERALFVHVLVYPPARP